MRTGLLESAIHKLFTRAAQVLAVDDIGGRFRVITLGGAALRDAGWKPGDKIQLQLGGWVQRTYTPIDWDEEAGRARILVALHADGPGTRWARAAREGERCVVFGPRRSVRLASLPAEVILFGDETSLGLAAALSLQAPVHMLAEVADRAAVAPVIARLGLDDVALYGAGDAAAQQAGMAAALRAHPDAEVILTGQAGSMQALSRMLRQQGFPSGRRQSKAYWASGKTGLD